MCGFLLQSRRVHDSEEQLHTTLFDIVVNMAVASAGTRHLPGASESERSGSAQCILRMSKWASCFPWMRRLWLVRLPDTDKQPRPSISARSAPNQEAWQNNLQRSREVRASVGLMLDSLQLVVMRYIVWSCSTAGVEQRFSVGDRLGVVRTPASHIIESLT